MYVKLLSRALALRPIDWKTGYMLIEAISRHGPVGYRKLRTIVSGKEYLNRKRKLPFKTFDRWITRLRNDDCLTKAPIEAKRGKTILIDLTDTAKRKHKLRALVISKYTNANATIQRKKASQKMTEAASGLRNEGIYLLSLILAIFGSQHIKKISLRSGDPIPETAAILHPDGKGYLSVIYEDLPGVGASDFFVTSKSLGLKTKTKTKRKVVRYSYRHPGISGLFEYFQHLSRSEIQKLLKKFGNVYPDVIGHFEYNGELRYGIKDPVVRRFLSDCVMALSMVMSRMELTWTIRRSKPKSEEVEWYELLRGKHEKNLFFVALEKQRKYLNKKLLGDIKDDDTIRTYYNGIKYLYDTLTGPGYKNIPEKSLPFKDELLNKIVFPPFLIEELKLHKESKPRIRIRLRNWLPSLLSGNKI